MDKEALMSLMKRSMMYRVMTDFNMQIEHLNKKLKDEKITHREISRLTGKADNSFNKSFNNNYKDMQISTFIRTAAATQQIIEETDIRLSQSKFFSSIFNDELLLYGQITNRLSDEDSLTLDLVIKDEEDVFRDLIQYWGIMSQKNKLAPEEIAVLEKINEILNDQEEVR